MRWPWQRRRKRQEEERHDMQTVEEILRRVARVEAEQRALQVRANERQVVREDEDRRRLA